MGLLGLDLRDPYQGTMGSTLDYLHLLEDAGDAMYIILPLFLRLWHILSCDT